MSHGFSMQGMRGSELSSLCAGCRRAGVYHRGTGRMAILLREGEGRLQILVLEGRQQRLYVREAGP